MEEKVSKEGRQEQLEEGEKYKEKTEAVEKIHQGGGRQCMEIDIWGGAEARREVEEQNSEEHGSQRAIIDPYNGGEGQGIG